MIKTKIKVALQLASDTEELFIGSGCISKISDLLKRHFPGATITVVADDNTFIAAGRLVNNKLKSDGINVTEQFVFPGLPILHADYRHVDILREFLIKNKSVAVAVGSGTINDIVKLASQESGRKYTVVPTAASVDGYSAYGAAILRGGFKETIKCAAPLAIIADTQILKLAPAEMTAAGYADLLGKITAGADWIIADSIGLEPIDPTSWNMVQQDLRKWTNRPKNQSKSNSRAFEYLFEGLTMSGLAMQAYRSSRPASGTEHHFSHIWEMQNLEKDGALVSHGFKVGIGTLAATAMMETIFAKKAEWLDIGFACSKYPSKQERENQIRKAFATTLIDQDTCKGKIVRRPNGDDIVTCHCMGEPIINQASGRVLDKIIATSLSKYLSKDRLRDRLTVIRSVWNDLQFKIRNQLLPYSKLREMLANANCPITPDKINISRERLKDTFFLAQMIRERYTVLDLAFELGCFKDCVEEIFSSGVYF